MEFVEKVKNAVVPNTTEPVASDTPQPESDMPGAFPDSDDEREAETQNQRNLTQRISASKPRNTGGESAAAAPTVPTSTGQLDAGRSAKARPTSPSSNGEPDYARADKHTSITEVRTHHLGNEGTTPPPRSSTTGEVQREEEAHEGNPTAAAAVAGAGAGAASASESLGQYSGTGLAGSETRGNGGIRNGVLGRGDSHLGTHLGLAPTGASSQEDSRVSAGEERSQGILPGGVHNTVSGHGSEHPHGEGADAPWEGQQRPRSSESGGSKTRRSADAVISGVSDSGLGLGGVHNGVVGHGSHDEENARH